jgi:hypothetical protein
MRRGTLTQFNRGDGRHNVGGGGQGGTAPAAKPGR